MNPNPVNRMQYRVRLEEGEPGEKVLFISGRISLENLNNFLAEARSLLGDRSLRKLDIDLGEISYLDSAGALTLLHLQQELTAKSIDVTLGNITARIRGILNLLNQKAVKSPPVVRLKQRSSFLERIGTASLRFRDDFVGIMSFAGELLLALASCFFHPRSVRWQDVLFYMKRAGVDGVPIVGLISILLGLIMAFMASLQLKLFGANIYVASLLAIAMVKELGPIMTAILVAGRSGSAFAAEIGTMMVNDEVNALKTMGFDPTRFLAVPKVLATLFVLPLLTMFADLFAILGGLLVGVMGLDLTIYSYIQQTQSSIDVFDIVASLVKAAVFAVLIAGIGCQRGFQASSGAESVGAAATSAVVSAIFLIIVADSAFALILHYIG